MIAFLMAHCSVKVLELNSYSSQWTVDSDIGRNYVVIGHSVKDIFHLQIVCN